LYETAPVTASQDKVVAVAAVLLATTLEGAIKEFLQSKKMSAVDNLPSRYLFSSFNERDNPIASWFRFPQLQYQY
jgi:hypothetical protein